MADGEGRKIYVANLPTDVKQDSIKQLFSIYGKLEEVFINPPKENRPERSAFVRFEDPRDAAAAVVILEQAITFPGADKPIQINMAHQRDAGKGKDKGSGDYQRRDDSYQRNDNRGSWNSNDNKWGSSGGGWDNNRGYDDRRGSYNDRGSYNNDGKGGKGGDAASKLWVGNLPADCTKETLEGAFGSFGRLTEVTLLPNKSRTGQMCAFVCYEDSSMADAALNAMQQGYQMKPGDPEIKVERPGARKKGDEKGSKGGYDNYGGAGKGGGYDSGKGGGYSGGKPY